MEQRLYHGSIDPNALAQHVLDTWDQGDTVAQALEGEEGIIVQVGQRTGGFFNDEPANALTLALEPIANGIRVTMGEQQWYRNQGGRIMIGGLVGFLPFFFTWPLGGGRDEPIDSQLWGEVWESIESYTRQYAASTGEIRQFPQRSSAVTGETTRLQRGSCPSCGTENPAGVERCRECGTFLRARDCPQCGVSNPAMANFCMRCGTSLNNERAVEG
jgi:ribosomal protein L40E